MNQILLLRWINGLTPDQASQETDTLKKFLKVDLEWRGICGLKTMSEEFARLLVKNLNRQIQHVNNLTVRMSLRIYRDTIIETMLEMGHKL